MIKVRLEWAYDGQVYTTDDVKQLASDGDVEVIGRNDFPGPPNDDLKRVSRKQWKLKRIDANTVHISLAKNLNFNANLRVSLGVEDYDTKANSGTMRIGSKLAFDVKAGARLSISLSGSGDVKREPANDDETEEDNDTEFDDDDDDDDDEQDPLDDFVRPRKRRKVAAVKAEVKAEPTEDASQPQEPQARDESYHIVWLKAGNVLRQVPLLLNNEVPVVVSLDGLTSRYLLHAETKMLRVSERKRVLAALYLYKLHHHGHTEAAPEDAEEDNPDPLLAFRPLREQMANLAVECSGEDEERLRHKKHGVTAHALSAISDYRGLAELLTKDQERVDAPGGGLSVQLVDSPQHAVSEGFIRPDGKTWTAEEMTENEKRADIVLVKTTDLPGDVGVLACLASETAVRQFFLDLENRLWFCLSLDDWLSLLTKAHPELRQLPVEYTRSDLVAKLKAYQKGGKRSVRSVYDMNATPGGIIQAMFFEKHEHHPFDEKASNCALCNVG